MDGEPEGLWPRGKGFIVAGRVEVRSLPYSGSSTGRQMLVGKRDFIETVINQLRLPAGLGRPGYAVVTVDWIDQ